MTALDRDQLLDTLQTHLGQHPRVIAAYLYGSHARGEAGPLSDVDVAVLTERGLDPKARFDLRLELLAMLIEALRSDDVDVILLNEAPHALQYRIFRDGLLLVSRDRAGLHAFKADAISRYLDFKPALDYREARVLERARRGELTHGPNPHRRTLEHHRRRNQRSGGDAGSVG